MKNVKNFLYYIPFNFLLVPFSLLSFWMINPQVNTFSASVSFEMPAHAQRGGGRGRAIREILEFVGSEVINSGVNWALDNAFNPRRDSISPSTQARATYIGSSFIAPVNFQGRLVNLSFFANSRGEWFGWYAMEQTWRRVYPPNSVIYKTADVYLDSSGRLFWLPPQ